MPLDEKLLQGERCATATQYLICSSLEADSEIPLFKTLLGSSIPDVLLRFREIQCRDFFGLEFCADFHHSGLTELMSVAVPGY